jgi:hypothetical protein
VGYLNDIFFIPAYAKHLTHDGLVSSKSAVDWVLGDGVSPIMRDVSHIIDLHYIYRERYVSC